MMRRLLLTTLFLPSVSLGSTLQVEIQTLWKNQILPLSQTTLQNTAGNRLSITRLSYLLSKAQLQRQDGTWIGANDWLAFLDLENHRNSFTLPNVPADTYRALRFEIGLDPTVDKGDPNTYAAGHALHPDTNRLHWGWRKGYIFLAVEGRYEQPDQKLGGFSYHLAGQECRGVVEVPLDLDLRLSQVLSLSFDAARLFDAAHVIDIRDSDSTHSGNDGGLAQNLADNAVRAFGVISLRPNVRPQSSGIETITTARGVSLEIPAHLPAISWPQDNPPSPAGVALGKKLFHDKRLSRNNAISCASCHSAEYAMSDPRQFSIGENGQVGTRNAMPLFNLAWKPSFFWDGRATTLRQQVLMPITDHLEMNTTLPEVIDQLGDLKKDFAKAFGDEAITSDRMALALEQFLLTLISADSPMDHTLTKNHTLTEPESRGMTLFFTESDPGRGIKGADCFHCHGGANFTNNTFLNNGLDTIETLIDKGRERVNGQSADRGKFMTPSLRNVALTAPYMHDGRFATLEEVVAHYNQAIKRSETLDPNLAKHLRSGGLNLSTEDQAALVSFLKALTDESWKKRTQ